MEGGPCTYVYYAIRKWDRAERVLTRKLKSQCVFQIACASELFVELPSGMFSECDTLRVGPCYEEISSQREAKKRAATYNFVSDSHYYAARIQTAGEDIGIFSSPLYQVSQDRQYQPIGIGAL